MWGKVRFFFCDLWDCLHNNNVQHWSCAVQCHAVLCCPMLCRYADGRFDLDNAKGPFRLDLGDVLYAPTVMREDQGRVVLWGWLQEKRTVRGVVWVV